MFSFVTNDLENKPSSFFPFSKITGWIYVLLSSFRRKFDENRKHTRAHMGAHAHTHRHASGIGVWKTRLSVARQISLHRHSSITWKFRRSVKFPFLLWGDEVHPHPSAHISCQPPSDWFVCEIRSSVARKQQSLRYAPVQRSSKPTRRSRNQRAMTGCFWFLLPVSRTAVRGRLNCAPHISNAPDRSASSRHPCGSGCCSGRRRREWITGWVDQSPLGFSLFGSLGDVSVAPGDDCCLW